MSSPALVVTTINPPTDALKRLRDGAVAHGWRLIVIGDSKSPVDFTLDGADYYDLDRQRAAGFHLSELAPERSYARKNLGYLLAMRGGAEIIVETDDDNAPIDGFWAPRTRALEAAPVTGADWVNVYAYFSAHKVWPRGLPLTHATAAPPAPGPAVTVEAPIQQGLADGDPDVDALYRLLDGAPITFDDRGPVALTPGVWCPFNSQNTTWFAEAFPLMYIPSTCTMRACDIWRGFVAQAWLHRQGAPMVFHKATMFQDRNEHDLMRDFEDETPVYLQARAFPALAPDEHGPDVFLRAYYDRLIEADFIAGEERAILDAWLADIDATRAGA